MKTFFSLITRGKEIWTSTASTASHSYPRNPIKQGTWLSIAQEGIMWQSYESLASIMEMDATESN